MYIKKYKKLLFIFFMMVIWIIIISQNSIVLADAQKDFDALYNEYDNEAGTSSYDDYEGYFKYLKDQGRLENAFITFSDKHLSIDKIAKDKDKEKFKFYKFMALKLTSEDYEPVQGTDQAELATKNKKNILNKLKEYDEQNPGTLSEKEKKKLKKNLDRQAQTQGTIDTIREQEGSPEVEINEDIYVYKSPDRTGKTNDDEKLDDLEQIIKDADEFVSQNGIGTTPINEQILQKQFSGIYNVTLQIGVGIAVMIGLVLGIKFMVSSVGEKADIKKMFIVYVVGCIAVFGSFGIWKLILQIMEKM